MGFALAPRPPTTRTKRWRSTEIEERRGEKIRKEKKGRKKKEREKELDKTQQNSGRKTTQSKA